MELRSRGLETRWHFQTMRVLDPLREGGEHRERLSLLNTRDVNKPFAREQMDGTT